MNHPIRFEHGKDKLIVMPFQPGGDRVPDGTGLGVHFLLGNLFCLHPGLLECWFGWRVSRIFPEAERLLAYCREYKSFGDIVALGEAQKVRFWLEGCHDEAGGVRLTLHDTRDKGQFSFETKLDFDSGLAGFRRGVLYWMTQLGLGFDDVAPALWTEKITPEGLECLGTALESLYLNYVAAGEYALDISRFERAADLCPTSYLCQDLLGWALYKQERFEPAEKAFLKAVALNGQGMGALAGLMWCAVEKRDRDGALAYALEKGQCRGDGPEKARAFVDKKFS